MSNGSQKIIPLFAFLIIFYIFFLVFNVKADDTDNAEVYLGATLGTGDMDTLSKARNADEAVASLKKAGSANLNYKLLAGVYINPYVAVQIQYADFGKYNLKEVVPSHGPPKPTRNANSLGFALVLEKPDQMISPYLTVGNHSWNYNSESGAISHKSYYVYEDSEGRQRSVIITSGRSGFYGGGIHINILPMVGFGVEYEQYRFGKKDVQETVNGVIRIGF